MLSEAVLEELTRQTPLCIALVRTEWPDFAVESKLQVVQTFHRSALAGTPGWLAEICLRDPSPILRYWAARHTSFNNTLPEKLRPGLEWLAASPDDLDLYARAVGDDCELVRMVVGAGMPTSVDYKSLVKLPQLQRLVFLRNLTFAPLHIFMDFLEVGVTEGVDDEHLHQCTVEFFKHPRVVTDLQRKSDDFDDGYEAYLCGEAMKRGWHLTATCGPFLRQHLSFHLPTRYGLKDMAVEELAALPEDVLIPLVFRKDTPETKKLVELVRQSPERFTQAVVERVKRDDEGYESPRPTPEEVADHQARAAVNQQEAMMEQLLALTRQLAELQESVNGLLRASVMPEKRRGFFG